jgi:hypothetical protein
MRKRLKISALFVFSLVCVIALGTTQNKAFSADITPETLNFVSQGNYLTAHIEQSILFKDDFSNPTWTIENWQLEGGWGGGTYAVEGEQYSGEGNYDPRSVSLAGSAVSPVEAYNFILDVKATTLVYGYYETYGGYDVGASIPFRYIDDGHMAVLSLLPGKIILQIEQGIDNPWYGQWEYSVDVGFTQHDVRLIANGDNYWVYVDDMVTPKIAVNFTLAGVGDGVGLGTRIGVWAYANAHIHYDDFVLKDYFDERTRRDINGDNVIDMKDIAIAAQAFGATPNHPRWNPKIDMNQDNKINLRDIAAIGKDFGIHLS